MILIDYIGILDGVHYYRTVWKDAIRVFEFSGEPNQLRKNMLALKAQIIIELYNDFILQDKQTVDRGKESPLYASNLKRVNDYLKWAIDNKEQMPGSVIENGFIITRNLKSIVVMISKEHPNKKNLLFIKRSIEQTCKVEFNIED